MRLLPFAGNLLVCDMDGTLLNSRHEVSPQNREALQRFVDLGGWFTVATGRMETSVQPYLAELPVNVPAILYNGALIHDFAKQETLYQMWLPDELKGVIGELQLVFHDLGIEVYANGRVYFVQQNEQTRQHAQKENFDVRTFCLTEIPKPWQKVMLVWEPELLQDMKFYLSERIGLLQLVFSEPQFLEILPAGCSKGEALQQLMKRMGISRSEVVAIGDNLNDLELLKTAGTGVAVDNAHPELKSIATFCCVDHNQHAVAEVIHWWENSKEGIK